MPERNFWIEEWGAAAAEMALILPLLLILMFGGMEASYYFWNEHRVVKAVRDGARYAGRMPFGAFQCGGGDLVDNAAVTNSTILGYIKNVTRTGTVDGSGAPVIDDFTDAQISVVSLPCDTATTKKGIFSDADDGAFRVRVIANASYEPLFSQLGFSTFSLGLRASSEAVVMGL